jgi:hypothetical protein
VGDMAIRGLSGPADVGEPDSGLALPPVAVGT